MNHSLPGLPVHCFLVFVINFVPLRTQSSVHIFDWEQDYWLDCPLPVWILLISPPGRLYLLPPPSLLYPTLWISLCVPDGGEHLRNWLLAGSVCLLLILPFILMATSVSFLPLLFSVTPWTSLSGPDCGAHIRKWLLASLLSPLLIPPHLISVTSNYPLPLLFSM